MAENDIYDSKRKFKNETKNLEEICTPPEKSNKRKKYYCKNRANLTHFKRLFKHFEARDLSYIRRIRLTKTLKMISFAATKDFQKLNRDDIDEVMSFMHTVYKSPKSKSDFVRDIKFMWKILFPERDDKGRVDDTVHPYPVRHLSPRIDKSREKRRQDKLTLEEFEKLVNFFSGNPMMQFYLTLAVESLGRPQEILYTKIKDVEQYENYAKIWISEHGKEGTGFLQVIDSYPYLLKWLDHHPLSKNPDEFLFINGYHKQVKPTYLNKGLKRACQALKIVKPITPYSLKRNGVTFRRLRGDSDMEIQHAARWTSTKQLRTYDLSQQDDAFKMRLVKKGLFKEDEYKHLEQQIKECQFCGHKNGFAADHCNTCKRPLDREKVRKLEMKRELELQQRKKEIEKLNKLTNVEQMQDLLNVVFKLQEEVERIKCGV